MAIHTVRDYILQNSNSGNRQYIPAYLMVLFLRRILMYTYVGDTNFPVSSVGTLLIATADSTPAAATPTFAAGTKAGINQGTGREFYVWVPPATRTVQLADVGRLLVLRSTANPTFNSGIFLITGFESLTYTITSATNTNPIVITTSTNHTLTTGQTIVISGVTGNTNANGTWTITVTGSNTFTIPVAGNGSATNGTAVANSYIIDYRTMGAAPPVEAFGSMNWYLYASDANCPVAGTPNGNGWPATYGGNGVSTTPRIILQSPHALGWQVRTCLETFADWSRNFNSNGSTGSVPCLTSSPGFGGNSAGDFAVGGPHLHTALFYSGTYDASDYGAESYVSGATPGYGEPGVNSFPYLGNYSTPYRITMVGDDGGQAVVLIARRHFDQSNPKSYILAFGIPENEPAPLPVNNTARLFVIGSGISASSNNDFGNSLNNIGFSTGYVFGASFGNSYTSNNTVQGVSHSIGGVPVSCAPSLWTYGTGSSDFGSPGFDGSASDSAWALATELFPVDLICGTETSWNGSTNPVNPPCFQYEPRMMGTIPHLRAGRANLGTYTTTNDANHAWLHLKNGVYVTWNGPLVVP